MNTGSLLATLAVTVMTVTTWGQTLAAEDIRVFIFAGQSNMEGADTNQDEVSRHPPFKGSMKPQEDVLYSYNLGRDSKSNGWMALQPVDGRFGPEITFARSLKKPKSSVRSVSEEMCSLYPFNSKTWEKNSM